VNIGEKSAKSRAKRHMPWYKRCPADWRSGTRSAGMSMELRGFYSECLDAMWELQGPLPKDSKALAMLLGSNPRQVRALMAKLIDLGKMVETDNGFHNPRMLADIFRERENLESSATEAPVDLQSTSKIPKNPMFSTRDLEADTEADPDPEREEEKLPSSLVAEGKVFHVDFRVGLGAANPLRSITFEAQREVAKALGIADAEPLAKRFLRWDRKQPNSNKARDLDAKFIASAATFWKNAPAEVKAACQPLQQPEEPILPRPVRASPELARLMGAR
jgi:uncharacterized protein YdaU (DUF1376 family)